MSRSFQPHEFAKAMAADGNYASDRKLIYQWTGTHWSMMEEDDCEAMAYRWIVADQDVFASDNNARRAFRSAALWLPPLPEMTGDIVIPCQNGYVHVADGLHLQEANPDLGIRHVLGCAYQPEGSLPQRFLAFLSQVLPDAEVQARVQEYVGYTLMSDARYQKAQLWLGAGANGKGVLANIIQALHGNVAAISLDALDGFRLSVLIGASLIYADEVPRQGINEQLLKSMIAGERVQVDRKYRDPVSIHVRGKWLVLGNHLPAVTDHSAGFWRRWDIVPFDVTIPEVARDPLLADAIIAHELPGVLNWALAGLLRLQQRGAFDPDLPEPMQRLLHDAKAETNSVLAWFEDCDIEAPASTLTSKDEVFAHYQDWCKRNGMSPMAMTRFWGRMKSIAPIEESRRREQGRQVRYCNVGLPGLYVSDESLAADSPSPRSHLALNGVLGL